MQNPLNTSMNNSMNMMGNYSNQNINTIGCQIGLNPFGINPMNQSYYACHNPNINQHINPNINIPINYDQDPNSCTFCEEIYKFIILNNMPLKMMTCLYCNKQMNGVSLEFYLRKYKNELEEQYKRVILGSTNIESKKDLQYENDLSISTTNHEIKSSTDVNRILPMRRHIYSKSRDDNEYACTKEINEHIFGRTRFDKNDRFKSIDSNANDNKFKEESVNFVLDTTDTGLSLAEVFKKKRAKLFNKIDERANSVKDVKNRSTVTDNSEENIEMKNIKKIKNKKELSVAPKINVDLRSIAEENKRNNTYTSINTEPSPELLNRLINGKKAEV
jgi:hypothetical protein